MVWSERTIDLDVNLVPRFHGTRVASWRIQTTSAVEDGLAFLRGLNGWQIVRRQHCLPVIERLCDAHLAVLGSVGTDLSLLLPFILQYCSLGLIPACG